MSSDPGDGSARGQTLPDFAVGIALFLLTITFVVLFLPQLTLPYEDQEQPVVVERVAGDLGNDMLVTESQPSKLDEPCTLAFFEQAGGSTCPFNTDDPLHEQLGVAGTYSVNVTLRDGPSDDPASSPLCESGGYDSITDCGSGTETLGVGPPIPGDDESVAVARQRVYTDTMDAVIEVGVW